MSSINFNAAATQALRTLQATNASLDATQGRISTGLAIGEAKDNAAYWSISTTMKSDNKALSTVSDALGLGGATIDTAYQGLNAAKDVLDEIKSKIVAASQNGVDKKAIQSEITELQKQLTSIATASTFSGENWLMVNSGLSNYTATKSVVSGMTRDAAGNFSINTIAVDTSSFALIDANGSGEAVLDAGKSGNSLLGGLASMATAAVGTAVNGRSDAAAAFAYVAGTGATPATETLALALTIDSSNFSFTLTDSTTFDTLDELVAQINQRIGGAGTASNNGGSLRITSATTGTTSTVDITTATFTGTGSPISTLAGVTAGDTSTAGSASAATTTMAGSFGTAPISLDENDSIDFQIELNGGVSKTVTIDRATITAALGEAANGQIASATEYATVLNKAFQNANVAGITADVAGSAIRLTSGVSGASSSIRISAVAPNSGTSILTFDLTDANSVQLSKYLNAVTDAISKVTTAASTLGAVASRIELQKDFVSTLMDTIDKGVSGLIDADMNEESTKLQALQVKQQLGVQALSIANQSAQSVLSLFRS